MAELDESAMPSTDETAAAWCVRLVGGSLSPAAQADLDDWLAAQPHHAVALAAALRVWDQLQAVGDAPELISRRADALGMLRRANRRRWTTRPSFGPWRMLVAAGLIAATVAVVAAAWLVQSTVAGAGVEYATTIGERRALLLPDGSRLSLDSATRVAVDLEPDHRALTLRAGRAKFDVAVDRSRPFTVTAGDSTVVATGTKFSVELLSGRTHVIVYEGAVVVTRGPLPSVVDLVRLKTAAVASGTALLPARELIVRTDGPPQSEVVRADTARTLGWEAGQLDFDDEPLASAVERLNRYSTMKIAIDDETLDAVAINGVFNAGDSLAFADAVADTYSLRVQREGSVLHISRRSPTH